MDLIKLLGRPYSDPKVRSALESHKIIRAPIVTRSHAGADAEIVKTQDWLGNSKLGVEFGFEDRGSYLGSMRSEFGNGEMVLREVYFYFDRSGMAAYEGKLPFGISRKASRTKIRDVLDASSFSRRSHSRDTWIFDENVLCIAEFNDVDQMSFMLFSKDAPVMEISDDVSELYPNAWDVLSCIGSSWTDIASTDVFARTRFEYQLERISPEQAFTDFTDEIGLLLDFSADGEADPLVLEKATFYGPSVPGVRIWPKELPYRLTFGLDWGQMCSTIGREPDDQSVQDFSIDAFWSGESGTLNVQYSTMTNSIIRVSLLAN